MKYTSLKFTNNELEILDQRLLPREFKYITLSNTLAVVEAIKSMAIRGAPLIGVAGAYGGAFEVRESSSQKEVLHLFSLLENARPTAVNLRKAVRLQRNVYEQNSHLDKENLYQTLIGEADKYYPNDVSVNQKIAHYGANLFPDGGKFMHICNTGSFATVGVGTALGILKAIKERSKSFHSYLLETRPRLQGFLSALELTLENIPNTILVDGASGALLAKEEITAIFVGCDRVARNGDAANKIGTHTLSLLPASHEVPFYVAAPLSSTDFTLTSGRDIPIEERDNEEVLSFAGTRISRYQSHVCNPSFDITPLSLITGFITEKGLFG
jgi:methylthioribose-1-phosphate isomerase